MNSNVDTLPMKIVQNELNSFKNKVVLGNGMATSIVAMFEDKTSKNSTNKLKALKDWLDGAANRDFLF